MKGKLIEITIDELGNIHVSKHNLSYSEALSTIDYARAQLRLDSMKNEETNVQKNLRSCHVCLY